MRLNNLGLGTFWAASLIFRSSLTRFPSVEVRAVRFRPLFVSVNWTVFRRIDIVKRCGEASTVVDVLSVKLTVLIVGLEKRTYGRGRCQSVSRTCTYVRTLTSTSISKTPRLSVSARRRGSLPAGTVILCGRPSVHRAMKEVCEHPTEGKTPAWGAGTVHVRQFDSASCWIQPRNAKIANNLT